MGFIGVTVDINVGCNVLGVLPAKPASGGNKTVDMVWGLVEFINDKNPLDRILTIGANMADGSYQYFKIGEYRAIQFTFGGVLMDNTKFDKKRIEKEDKIKLNINASGWFGYP